MLSFLSTRPHPGAAPRSAGPGVATPAASEVLARPLALARGSAREELRALAEERDSRLFFEGLLGFAARQEQAGRMDLAVEVYSAVATHANDGMDAAAVGAVRERPLRNHAQRQLDAILGRGAFGPRAEFLLRNFAHQAGDPAALFAMGAAGSVFRLTRLATLGRLAVSPSANFFTRGFGARAVAGLTGFALEAPTFTLAGRAANAALGRTQDWSTGALGREFASSFLVLGGLKLAGWASGATYSRFAAPVGAGQVQPLPLVTRSLFQQGGMFAGILFGHRMEEMFGLRPHQPGATTLVDSLAMLLQFNVAGNLTRHAFGPRFAAWERGLDLQAETLTHAPRTFPGFGTRELALAGASISAMSNRPTLDSPRPNILMMEGGGNHREGGAHPRVRLPRLGIRSETASSRNEALNRAEAERQSRALVPRGFVETADLARPGFVAELLNNFGITQHDFDQAAFRQGFEIARRHPERVARLAFDIDEVYLHWAFSPRDLFQGMTERGREPAYYNTEASLLDYQPFQVAPGIEYSWAQRLWFRGIQTMLPSYFRQHVQLHPGVRAFQLGLRLGQDKNLIMATTGPADRIMRLANEDPAMKMIYFGKGPTESVTIAEVRAGLNIYTREDLVYAMRELVDGEIRFEGNPLVESYLAKIREFPDRGVKLKHPAISLLRGKRAFDTLVDDSGSTFEMLGSMPGFTVLQPPSARPSLTLNFTLGSPHSYLDRMSNGYVRELAELLTRPEAPASTRLSPEPGSPEDYPAQRFAIAIPWDKFGLGFVAPANELRLLGRRLARPAAAETAATTAADRPALSLNETQLARLTDRLHREFELILDERPGTVSVEAAHTLMYRDLAQSSPEDFQAMLDRFFTASEQADLPGAERPLEARGPNYFSRVAAVMAAKRAVCNLLALDPAEHSREVGFRFGRPLLSGTAAQRLGSNQLMTTLADDGEVGIGVALIESAIWESGLVGIGLDVTTDRVRYTEASRHALAEAAYKATYPVHPIRRFTHHRAEELVQNPDGSYALTGKTMGAARELRGDASLNQPLPVRALDFRIGDATVALVAVPSLDTASRRPRPFGEGGNPSSNRGLSEDLYIVDASGRFELPRENMSVAILGDVAGTRAIDLARQGHFPVSIERDPEMLEMTERLFGTYSEEFSRNGTRATTPRGDFVLGDWYETTARADRVEAYFPLHVGDLPRPGSPNRAEAVQAFLDQALLSKIVPGGGGYVVSENESFIRDLATLVDSRSNLELVEYAHNQKNIPLVAGYAVASPFRDNSWLVFRRKP